jgi:hypothetical protein
LIFAKRPRSILTEKIHGDRSPLETPGGLSNSKSLRVPPAWVCDSKATYRTCPMSLSMKKISAYKNRAVIIMIFVMSFHILSGLRLFCADRILPPIRAHAGGNVALAVTLPGHGSADVSAGISTGLDNKGDPSQCSCKKKPKCAAIPRAVITSNPAHRVSELQRQAKSLCYDTLVPQMTTKRFAEKHAPPLIELGSRAPSHCLTSLSLTCILLI